MRRLLPLGLPVGVGLPFLMALCAAAGLIACAGVEERATDSWRVPDVSEPLERVFVPEGTRYLNDHTLVQEADGTWHLWGITDDSEGEPFAEQAFLHATAPALEGPWTSHEDALLADADLGEQAIWAPHVIERDGVWWMYYWAVPFERDETKNLRVARSQDLWEWERISAAANAELGPPGGRDPFVMQDGARWLLYSVGVDSSSRGQIVVTQSTDPDDPEAWSEPETVIMDPAPQYSWGNLESPFVVRHDGRYYLFLTRTGPEDEDYFDTQVFVSDDPISGFFFAPVSTMRAHAAEILQVDDEWWITSAGWTAFVGEDGRGLSIAPLEWGSGS